MWLVCCYLWGKKKLWKYSLQSTKSLVPQDKTRMIFFKTKKTWNFSKIFFKTWRNRKVSEKYSLTVPENFWELFFSRHEWTGKYPRNILRKFEKISENFSFENMNELESFRKILFWKLESSGKLPRNILLRTWKYQKISEKSF